MKSRPIPQEMNMEQLAAKFKALADPKRLQIFLTLMEGIQCNCELGDALHMAPNLISHHLHILRDAGLIDSERDAFDARWVYYSVNPVALETLSNSFGRLFATERIKPRHSSCGPSGALMHAVDLACETSPFPNIPNSDTR